MKEFKTKVKVREVQNCTPNVKKRDEAMNENEMIKPCIEDLHVGMDVETEYGKCGTIIGLFNHNKVVLDSNFPCINVDDIRIKPLDHDDIVALGWEFVKTSWQDPDLSHMYKISHPPGDHVLYWEESTEVVRIYSANGPFEFSGHIPHKHALKKVMEWTGIKKD